MIDIPRVKNHKNTLNIRMIVRFWPYGLTNSLQHIIQNDKDENEAEEKMNTLITLHLEAEENDNNIEIRCCGGYLA